MKRSAFKPSTKPMSRGTPMARGAPGAKRSTLKAKPKRHTKAESVYLDAVAALGCAVCRRLGYGATPAIVHHQRTGTGMMRATHYRTCPLCPPHHQSSGYGVHDMGREEFAKMYGFTEVDLIEETRATLAHLLNQGA